MIVAIRRGPAELLRGLIRLYQLCLRPVLGPNCRFVPSCSDYALQAIAMYGVTKGVAHAGGRILRCNPWNPGGHDPLPATSCSCRSPLPDRDRPIC